MAESLTIPGEQQLSEAEDYDFLRMQGIAKIQALCGDVWTDYNEHDPGITLLEAICFALTELGYRAGLDIGDLIAPGPGEKDPPGDVLYAATKILPCNPVTLTDYRKLIADIAGVRNAWVMISGDSELPVYCMQKGEGWQLTCDADQGEELLPLKGLYRVLVEFEEDVKREGREELVIGMVKDRLHRHRNLCEDFVSVSEIEYDPFSIDAEIVVREGADIDLINAKIYKVIRDLFSPAVNFYTLQQMRQKGYTVEEIFEGPLLQHGFIDSVELEHMSAGKDIRLSDIINRITGIEGVIAIRKLAIPKESQSAFSAFTQWVGDLRDQDKMPRLDTAQSTVRFVRNGDRYRGDAEKMADPDKVNAILSFLLISGQKVKLKRQDRDLAGKEGTYKDAGSYFPFQRSLPSCYGMEEQYTGQGKPVGQLDPGPRQVLQLRAFLMLFEQLLANYMSQLAHIRDFFSIHDKAGHNYFTQIPEAVHDVEALFVDFAAYKTHAEEILENPHARLGKRNKIIDHLLARMGETMTGHSAHAGIFFGQKAAGRLIADKAATLRDIVDLTRDRGKAFDYTDARGAWNTQNVAGAKKRICRLLGMKDYERRYISSDALYLQVVQHDNGILRYVVKLVDPLDRKYLLLESIEYEFEREAIAILNYMLEEGMDRHRYAAEDRHGQPGYSLTRQTAEGRTETVAYRHFEHREVMERSFERTIAVLTDFSGEESLHLVEHMLLRPRIGGRGVAGKKNMAGLEKESVLLMPVPQTDDPVEGKAGKGPVQKAPYRFRIKEGWRLSLLNDSGEEILSVKEEFLFYKHLTARMDRLRSAGADRVNYHVSRNADGYFVFAIVEGDRQLAEGKKKCKEEKAMEQELEGLVRFFAYERQNRLDNDDADEDRLAALDPYSFHVTVVLPSWPQRFRDPGFRHLVEKTIFLEIPAHISPHVYWVGHADMRRFEEAYKLWLEEQCSAPIPNTEVLNNLLSVLEALRLHA